MDASLYDPPAQAVATPHPGMGFAQFVALCAALMAVNAMPIDIMLPALGKISASLHLTHPNQRQWIITAYLLGFGASQILYGTLADRFGRKRPLTICLVLFVLANLLAAFSSSFEMLLLARVLMGVGAAGSRVIGVAIVRDCYAGRRMARVMSLSTIIFLLVPMLAPSLGQLIMYAAPWQGIFIALALYGIAVLIWMSVKLPETLRPADRQPIGLAGIANGLRLTLGNRVSLGYTLAGTLVVGGLLGFINCAQQLFSDSFHAPGRFTLIFASIAGAIALASLLNARLVERFGSRLLSHVALLGFIGIAALHAGIAVSGHETLLRFALLQAPAMFCFGLMVGNFGAMSMAPLGAVAGSAAAIQGFLSTIGAALIGLCIGLSFDGSAVPLALGNLACGLLALAVVLAAEGGRLFHGRETALATD